MNKRILSLKREALTELATSELAVVVGGSDLCTVGHGPSFDEACPTTPIRNCLAGLTDRTCITISPDMCIWTR